MFHRIVTFILSFTCLRIVSSENLTGIFLIDSCECNSPSGRCEPHGPFTLNQARSALILKYGALQVGVGRLGNNQLDLYLNQNLCKGAWNRKMHVAELQCQQQSGILCTIQLRCIFGSCLKNSSTAMSSARRKTTISFLFMIGILIMLV